MQLKGLFLALAGATLCYGRATVITPATTSARCPDAVTLHTDTISSSNVKMTQFACGNATEGVTTDLRTIVDANPGALQSRASPVFPRQFQNCEGGAADQECECATLCGPLSFCSDASFPPTQADCNVISNALSSTPGSFFVPSGQGVSFTAGSCEVVFVNEATTELEYCFENIATLTSAAFVNCIELGGGGVGGCIADDFLWFFELLLVGNPIQVP